MNAEDARRAVRCLAVTALVAAGIGSLAGMASAQQGQPTPPFVTTPPEVVTHMLRMAGTGASDYVIDLGSGDGRIVIAAAKEFGARARGIELDGKLVRESRENARAAGVADRVSLVEGDVLRADISGASVVTLYLLPWLMEGLQPRLLSELKPGTRIVSHAFAMPGWRADRVETVNIVRRAQYHGDTTRVLYWVVPAQVRGAWRARTAAGDLRLDVSQNYQEVEIDATLASRVLRVSSATLSGTAFAWRADDIRYAGRVEGDRIVGELETPGSQVPLVFTRDR